MSPIERFIVAHDLHRHVPVDLGPLRELAPVKFLRLSEGTLGGAFANEVGCVIGINRSLGRDERRMTFCHELAHLILEHPNSLWLCRIDGWWYSRYERQAQQAAALMLIPFEPLRRRLLAGYAVEAVAGAFRVPRSLVELRVAMAEDQLLPRVRMPQRTTV
ncbi:MAG: ImmA/IrrE family metallo-endopeptidase [Chloroflexi bacterium]|nr:ImmA/IrrE family metallo-endopeptidase [Chloroflexota bacterium]MCL5107926.1 ImmA/IrrE family metallo-endopeptidase [Chloroflexota bacterium]